MTRFCSFAAVTALALVLSANVVAQGPLKRIPRDADIVVRLKAPQETIDRAAALANAAQAGFGDMVRQQASFALETAIGVPGLAGVDMSRDWFLAVFANTNGQPDAFLLIPATSTEQLTSALPDGIPSRVDEDWVVFSVTADEIPAAAESGQGITSVMTNEDADVFKRGNLSVFINVPHLRGVYKDQLAFGKSQVDVLLEQFAQAAQQANGMNMKAIMDMYRTMILGGFQALEDARGCSAAITISEEGVQLEEYVAFTAGSQSANVIAGHSTSAMPSLAQLPSNATGYFGIRGNMQQFMEWGWSMNLSMIENDQEQKDKFKAALQKWQEVEFGDMVGSFQLGGDAEGLFQYSAIAQVKPIDKFRDNMWEMVDLFGQIKTMGLTQEMSVEQDAESIGARSIDMIKIKQTFDASLDPTGTQAKMQEIMFGPDGMVSRLTFLDGFYAQSMGGGRQAMELLLVSIDRPPNADMAKHRAGLIAEPNLLMLLDVPNMVVSSIINFSKIPDIPFPIEVDELTKIDLQPSYAGFSLAGEPNALRAKTVIPAEQFRGVAAIVNFFQSRQR